MFAIVLVIDALVLGALIGSVYLDHERPRLTSW
jgi:hypothetical protein